MSDTADRYRRYAAGFTQRVANVPADRWNDPSPCNDWTARDVVRHSVEAGTRMLGFAGLDAPAGPSADDDPLAAWIAVRDATQRALDDPAVAATEFEGQLGTNTFEGGVAKFVAPDVLVHTWDLARATGQDDTLDTEGMEQILANWQPMDAMMRQPQVFAAKIDPPQADDIQTRLLNFTGRRV